MRNDLTELVFILDRSGSMSGLEGDTIGGFNSLLEKQKGEPGAAVVTTVLFDNHYELLHDRIDLAGVAPITDREYYVRGSTALLDAIGRTLVKTERAQANTLEAMRAGKTLVVIITDGMENASREYTAEKVRAMIERQKERGWEFLFLGANIDAVDVASRYGVDPDKAARYSATSAGTRLNYDVISDATSALRHRRDLPKDWKRRIDEREE